MRFHPALDALRPLFLFMALMAPSIAYPAANPPGPSAVSIHFQTKHPGFVSLNILNAKGAIVRHLLAGAQFTAGDHTVAWDGAADPAPAQDAAAAVAAAAPLPAGEYTWSAVIHDGLALRLRGWVGDWGGDRGPPSAVTSDDSGVYLGWTLATGNAETVVACTTDGALRWTHRRGALSGCRALASDAGVVFVLGGEGPDAAGAILYKLSAKDGTPVPWTNGRNYLSVSSLWGANGKDKPVTADYLAAKNGRIYLSFTEGNFISVLDAKSGAYLQTIVGSPPGAIDAVGTKCDAPDEPGSLVDADFIVIALKDGSLGKLLVVHDPIWVAASDLTPMGPDEEIAALTMIGDGSKHRMHDIFLAMAPPANQIQARPALDSASRTYVAGKGGNRPLRGPWEPDSLSAIRAITLDATGQLWAAEGDATPGRVSVWSTDAPVGRLVHEFFAPPAPDSPVAIDPRDPLVMIAGGCEWRIDPVTGRAKCLGIVTRDPVRDLFFVTKNDSTFLVLTPAEGPANSLERIGEGDYRLFTYTGPGLEKAPSRFQLLAAPDASWQLLTADGYILGTLFRSIKAVSTSTGIKPPPASAWPPSPESTGKPTLTQTLDGRIHLTAGTPRIWNLELTGMATLRPLAGGKFTLPPH